MQFSSKFLLASALLPLVLADMWMHVTVKKIDRKPCHTEDSTWGSDITGCTSMSYMTLDERILPNYERRSTSFEHIDGVTRPTVTHWPKGNLNDWMLSLQFIAIDPLYGIARTCDRSGYIRVFQSQNLTESAKSSPPPSSENTDGFAEKTIQVHGQCFIATVHIQASREICPWCIQESENPALTSTTPSSLALTSTSESGPDSSAFTFASQPPFLLIALLCLSVVSIVALVGTGILLVFYIIDRKTSANESTEFSVFNLPPAMKPIKQDSNNSTYIRTISPSSWTTQSSENWCEYPTERWSSYNNGLHLESRCNPVSIHITPEDGIYQEMSEEEVCVSPDSGRDSL